MLFRRQQEPPRLKNYQDYKPYLRKDFCYRCAYCLIDEARHGGLRSYGVDHFRPKKKFRRLVLTYTNLYYACNICNTNKGSRWPSGKQLKRGLRFVDPCLEDPYGKHFEVEERDGSLRILTDAGRYTVAHLRLDRNQLKKERRRQIEVRQYFQEVRDLLSTPRLQPEEIAKAKKKLEKLEQWHLDPLPLYEVEDLQTYIAK